MKCSHCSHENADDFLFCENCGERLGKECTECGHANDYDFAFCENCGHKFAAEPAYFLASEELAQTAPPAKPAPKRKQKASSVPASEEAVPAQAPPPQVVVVQQEKRRRLPAWLWLVLFAAVIFFILIGPRQPNYQPVVSSAGQSGGSGNTSSGGQSSGSSGNTSSGGQTSSGSTGNTSSDPQPTNTPRPPDSESNLSPARITVDQDSNCRYGPSASSFDVRRTIFDGQTVPIVGRGAAPAQEWWVVEVDGVQCWVWEELGKAGGDYGSVGNITPPAIPTPEPTPTDTPEPAPADTANPSFDPCEADYWIESISFPNNRKNVEMVLGSNDAFISESDADSVFYLPELDDANVAGHCDYINASRIECLHSHKDLGGGGGWSQGQFLQVGLYIEINNMGESSFQCFDVFVGEVVVP